MADDPIEGEDDRISVDLEDDETTGDPTGEAETEGTESEDAAGADETSGDDAEGEPVVAAPSRRSERVQALANERRQLAEQNAQLTRQLDELRRNPPVPQAPPESPQQRADRLSLLSPEDRIRTEVEERIQHFERGQAQTVRQLQDTTDQTNFRALAARNPLAAKMESQVEQALAGLRARGQDLPRQAVFTYLVGERALAQLGKSKPAAAANRARQQARPAGARGDVRPDRSGRRGTGTAADIEARFGDVPI